MWKYPWWQGNSYGIHLIYFSFDTTKFDLSFRKKSPIPMKAIFSATLLWLTLGIMLTSAGCGGEKGENESGYYEAEDTQMEMAAPERKEAAETVERKLIKQGRVEFETDKLQDTRERILAAVAKYEAYISSDQENKWGERINHTVVIRVPAKNFDQLLAEATQGVRKFDMKEITVTDVTEEFLDVNARLNTKKELELRYLELLKQARTVSEMLEIERELGNIRADIESMQGRLNYLQDQVSLSTLTITYYETVSDQDAFGRRVGEGLGKGWDNLKDFMVGLVNIWPFILLIFAALVLWRRRRRKARP